VVLVLKFFLILELQKHGSASRKATASLVVYDWQLYLGFVLQSYFERAIHKLPEMSSAFLVKRNICKSYIYSALRRVFICWGHIGSLCHKRIDMLFNLNPFPLTANALKLKLVNIWLTEANGSQGSDSEGRIVINLPEIGIGSKSIELWHSIEFKIASEEFVYNLSVALLNHCFY